jgi:putative NIF3 family GTP cyclohydrolase 1 type 2
MKTSEIFNLGIQLGMKKEEKNDIDAANPYPDSQVLYAKKNREIKKIAAGIDMGIEEIFLAKKMFDCDLVISHHPYAQSIGQLPDILLQQTGNLEVYGISTKEIGDLIKRSSEKLKRQVMEDNFFREIQICQKLDIDFINLHTPLDNLAVFILKKMIADKKLKTQGDFIDAVLNLSEFKMADRYGQKAFIANGKKEDLLGKVSFSEFLGGQESDAGIFQIMKRCKIDTVIVPHLSENFFQAAVRAGLKVIYCGHMASDSLGFNFFIDEVLRTEKQIEVISLGGLLRL